MALRGAASSARTSPPQQRSAERPAKLVSPTLAGRWRNAPRSGRVLGARPMMYPPPAPTISPGRPTPEARVSPTEREHLRRRTTKPLKMTTPWAYAPALAADQRVKNSVTDGPDLVLPLRHANSSPAQLPTKHRSRARRASSKPVARRARASTHRANRLYRVRAVDLHTMFVPPPTGTLALYAQSEQRSARQRPDGHRFHPAASTVNSGASTLKSAQGACRGTTRPRPTYNVLGDLPRKPPKGERGTTCF